MLASCLAAQWQCLCANAFLLNVPIAFIYTTSLERVIAVLKNPGRLSLPFCCSYQTPSHSAQAQPQKGIFPKALTYPSNMHSSSERRRRTRGGCMGRPFNTGTVLIKQNPTIQP